jgi:hypothetical protein
VAHQLEVTVKEIEQFKRQNELVTDDDTPEGAATPADFPDEIDLRAEDDALIAEELEAAALEAEEAARVRAEERAKAKDSDDEDDDEDAPKPRRRSRRGGRGRRSPARDSGPLEGTFEHGEEGYGLWLDPAVQDNPIYAEHWAGHRPVEIVVEEDQIIIRRTSSDDEG